MTASRVGQGFDVHPFSDDPTRPLVLGGVRFDGEPGLAGHSDADVVAQLREERCPPQQVSVHHASEPSDGFHAG